MIHSLVPVLAVVPMDWVVFGGAAAMILSGALGVVFSRHPIYAALSLVLTLFGVAVLFVEQNAQFLAAVQVIVYAGAIVVLFLFVIMLLGVDRQEDLRDPLPAQRPLAAVFGVVLLGEVFALTRVTHWATGATAVVGPANGGSTSNTARLARSVFTAYLLPFELTSLLLIIAVLGAVVLARRPRHGRATPPEMPAGDEIPAGEPGPDDERVVALDETGMPTDEEVGTR